MLGKFRGGSLQTAIILSSTLLVAVILLVVMGGLAARDNQIVRDDAVARTRQTVTQGGASLGSYMSGAMETMALFKSLVQDAADVQSRDLAEHMLLVRRQRADIASLSLFAKDGELVISTSGQTQKTPVEIRGSDWFLRAALARPSTVSVSQPYLQDAFHGQYAWVVTLSTQVEYVRMGRAQSGILSMDLRFSAIEQLLSEVQLGASGYVYLLGPDYQMIYHNQLPLIQLGLKSEDTDLIRKNVIGEFFDTQDARERFVVVLTVDSTRWRLVGVAYMDELAAANQRTLRMIVLLLVSGILMALSVAILMGRLIVRPLGRLTRIMRAVEGGNLDVAIPGQSFSEIQNLASAFRRMLDRIKILMHENELEQEQKRRYELDALQAQINPHFLYNTLDSIVWMQERGQNQDAIQMVTALARLFRISISKGRSVITVAEELEHVRNYLIIQSIRFKNKFTYSITAQPEALYLRTVKLILQPLVENSIVHGLSHFMTDEGRLAIEARVEDGILVLSVRDNGLGMRPEEVEAVLARRPGGGIGLANVNERIQLTFGSGYGLTLESEQDVGTLVVLRQPAVREEGTP
jgi:two-component system sensor histidine kinase YesM